MDIVERLRKKKEQYIATVDYGIGVYEELADSDTPDADCIEAADEIERLREDKRLAFKLMSEFLEKINRLRRGLHRIVGIETDPDFGTLPISEAQKIAQDTLEEE